MNKTIVITEKEYNEYLQLRNFRIEITDEFCNLKKQFKKLKILTESGMHLKLGERDEMFDIIIDSIYDTKKEAEKAEKIINAYADLF